MGIWNWLFGKNPEIQLENEVSYHLAPSSPMMSAPSPSPAFVSAPSPTIAPTSSPAFVSAPAATPSPVSSSVLIRAPTSALSTSIPIEVTTVEGGIGNFGGSGGNRHLNITCGNKGYINNIRGKYSNDYLTTIGTNCNKSSMNLPPVGSNRGREFAFACPSGFSEINGREGSKIFQLGGMCSDGTVFEPIGSGGNGTPFRYKCPSGEVLHSIEAKADRQSVNSLNLRCKAEYVPITGSVAPISPAPSQIASSPAPSSQIASSPAPLQIASTQVAPAPTPRIRNLRGARSIRPMLRTTARLRGNNSDNVNALGELLRNADLNNPPSGVIYYGKFDSSAMCSEQCELDPNCEVWTWNRNNGYKGADSMKMCHGTSSSRLPTAPDPWRTWNGFVSGQ